MQDSESKCYILGTSHCADMSAPSTRDIPSMVWAHAKINATVTSWLKGTSDQAADTTSAGTSSSDSASYSTGAVAGIAVGVALGTLALAAIFLYFFKPEVFGAKPKGSSNLQTNLI